MMDYMRPENEVCFAPSVDFEEVVVSIIADDDFEESSELFLLQLSSRTVAYPVQVKFPIARSVATITIVENPGNRMWNIVNSAIGKLVRGYGRK